MKPRFKRDSAALMLAFERYGRDESLDEIPVAMVMGRIKILTNPTEILRHWEAAGWGAIRTIDDGYNSYAFFDVSESGKRQFKKLKKQTDRAESLAKLRGKVFPAIGVVAAIVAAIAASVSAYFSYLGLPK